MVYSDGGEEELSFFGRPVDSLSEMAVVLSAVSACEPWLYATMMHDEYGGHLYLDYTCRYEALTEVPIVVVDLVCHFGGELR